MKNDEEENRFLSDAIQAMIPKNLDDVIRINKDIASLRLTTNDEIEDLYFPISYGLINGLPRIS